MGNEKARNNNCTSIMLKRKYEETSGTREKEKVLMAFLIVPTAGLMIFQSHKPLFPLSFYLKGKMFFKQRIILIQET